MFNRKSSYALNKKDPNAIVYMDANEAIIRLTREDFAREEEFLKWKSLSDADYEHYLMGEIDLNTYKAEKAACNELLLKTKNAYAAVLAQAKQKQDEQARQDSRKEASKAIFDADTLTTELAELLIDRVLVYPDKRIEIAYKIYGAFCPADAAAPLSKALPVFFPSSCRLSQCVLDCTDETFCREGSAGNGIHPGRLYCQHLVQQRQRLLIVGLILAGGIQHRNIGHFSVLDGHRHPDDIAKTKGAALIGAVPVAALSLLCLRCALRLQNGSVVGFHLSDLLLALAHRCCPDQRHLLVLP